MTVRHRTAVLDLTPVQAAEGERNTQRKNGTRQHGRNVEFRRGSDNSGREKRAAINIAHSILVG